MSNRKVTPVKDGRYSYSDLKHDAATTVPLSHANAEGVPYHSTIAFLDFLAEGVLAFSKETAEKKKLAPVPRPVRSIAFNAVHSEELRYFAFDRVQQTRAHTVVAPPGIGKSTKLPVLLHSAWQDTAKILLMEPTDTLAAHHYDNMRSMSAPVVLDDGRLDLSDPDNGRIVITTPGKILARVAGGKPLPEKAIVQHDEVHESDYLTTVFKLLWPGLPWIKRYVTTTATLTGAEENDGERARNAARLKKVKMRMPAMEDIAPSQQLADGRYAPWSIESLYGKRSLVFLEVDHMAQAYARQLNKYFPCERLSRGSTLDDVNNGIAMLDEAGPEGAVLVLDSSFQTGYNFPAEHVIDFGLRRFTYSASKESTVMTDRYRHVTAAEARQRAERVGRNSDGVVVHNDKQCSGVSILVEGEIEHLAVLLFLLGFECPSWVDTPVSSSDMVEVDLQDFFKSRKPWFLWRQTAKRVPESTKYFGTEKPAEPEPPVVAEEVVLPEPSLQERLQSWAQSIKDIDIKHLMVLGNFLKLEDGVSILTEREIEVILGTGATGLLDWLREVIEGTGVKKLRDRHEYELVWAWRTWVSLWNNNAATIVAVDKMVSKYLTSSDNLTGYGAEYRTILTKKMRAVSDLHDILVGWVDVLSTVMNMNMARSTPLHFLIDQRVAMLMPHKPVTFVTDVEVKSTPQLGAYTMDHVDKALAKCTAKRILAETQKQIGLGWLNKPSQEAKRLEWSRLFEVGAKTWQPGEGPGRGKWTRSSISSSSSGSKGNVKFLLGNS
uniref:Helicase n=1 Tax=Austropuccinia psidii associated ssRNA virus 1 TaxID=3180356 RepID=A0AAU7YQ47_9VIRU